VATVERSAKRVIRSFAVDSLRAVNMFRRQINNSRRWISHHSRPPKSSTVLIRGVVVATSVAAAAAAIANQQFVGGSIHNDAAPSTAAPRSDQTAAPAKTRDNDGDEGLRLLVWGSNRFAFSLTHPRLILTATRTVKVAYHLSWCIGRRADPYACSRVFPPGRGAARPGSTRDARRLR
jgi:hypothetical protein